MAFPWLPVLSIFIVELREFGVAILAWQAALRLQRGVKNFYQAEQGKKPLA
jgi:hypothetical protein